MMKCPCCKNNTIYKKPPGTFGICPICNWEDDEVQYNDPTYAGEANEMRLNDARRKYRVQKNYQSNIFNYVST